MGNNTEIITYQQSDIMEIMRVIDQMSSNKDARIFYAFAQKYSPRKICQILNNNGFDNITHSNNVDMVDCISRNLLSKVANRKYINTLLYSPYYYTKYVLNPATNQMEEQNIWLAYNALADNFKVDIKKKFSLENVRPLVESGNVVFLGVKEKHINVDKMFFENLIKVDKDFFTKAQNGFVQNNIFPSVKYADNFVICNNILSFERRFPRLSQELFNTNKKIMQKVLGFEVQNQQIILSNALEKGQQQFMNIVEEYQRKAGKIQDRMELNAKLLNALGENQATNDYQFTETNINEKKL
ncbi:MAG: hypothetical protein IKR12_01670 [Clostridia bacterium]|nr:hypothetical protein [Clostridia bacterium]